MAQQQSPWLEGAYGWSFGEGGWNTGMNQNLLKFSFMFDRNVDSVTSSLPAAVNGQAHYLTTDNRLYFAVGTTYFSTPVPKWFEFKDRSTGNTYLFNGTSATLVDSPSQLDARLDAVELTVSSLGSAAFEDVGFFATQSELDVAAAQANAYTDTLRGDLAENTDFAKNSGQISFNPALPYLEGTVGAALNDLQTVESDVTVFIPTDYATITAACDAVMAGRYGGQSTITIRLEAGYQIPVGIKFVNADLRRVVITSVDATVTLSPTFVGVTGTGDTFAEGSIFYGTNSKMPRLGCLIDAADVGGPGYCVQNNSEGYVSGACGVINAGKYGLYVANSSRCIAVNANFSLANWGNRVTTNSTLHAPQINCSGAKLATYEGSNTTAAMDVSRGSLVYITGVIGAETNLTNSAGRGLAVRRSFVSATSVNASNAALDGIRAETGSWVAASSSIVNSCLVDNISCYASWVDASGGVSATSAGRYNILVQDGGRVNARNATLTGGTTRGVTAVQGSQLTVNGANCRRNGVSDQTTDIFVSDGSIIHASGALGGTNITTLTLNTAGLIFK